MRLVERVLVDVAVERVGADVAVVGVAENVRRGAQAVPRRDVDEGRAIVGRVRLRVDARVVALEKAAAPAGRCRSASCRRSRRVTRHVVRRRAASRACRTAAGRRTASRRASRPRAKRLPARYQCSPLGLRAAVLELDRAARRRCRRSPARVVPRRRPAVLGLDRQRAAERVQPEQRIRSRHQRRRRDREPRESDPSSRRRRTAG